MQKFYGKDSRWRIDCEGVETMKCSFVELNYSLSAHTFFPPGRETETKNKQIRDRKGASNPEWVDLTANRKRDFSVAAFLISCIGHGTMNTGRDGPVTGRRDACRWSLALIILANAGKHSCCGVEIGFFGLLVCGGTGHEV